MERSVPEVCPPLTPIDNSPRVSHPNVEAISVSNQRNQSQQAEAPKCEPWYRSALRESEFNSHVYDVKTGMLEGGAISELMRAKLRTWLYSECARLSLSRRLCCVANTLIDLYLSKGGIVEVQQFHSLGIASLLVANKLGDHYIIPVDNETFPREELREWEGKLCWKLQFRLHPLTYVELLYGLLTVWGQFACSHKLWSYEGFGCQESLKLRHFNPMKAFEILDYLRLIMKSNSFARGMLEWEVLRLLLERDFNKMKQAPMSIEDEVVISFWVNPEENTLSRASFVDITNQFGGYLRKQCGWVLTGEGQIEAKKWVGDVLLCVGQVLGDGQGGDAWYQSGCEGWFRGVRRWLRVPKEKGFRKGSGDTTV